MPILIVIYALIYGYFTENKKNIELAQNVSGQPWAKEKTSLWAGLGQPKVLPAQTAQGAQMPTMLGSTILIVLEP